MFDHAYVIKRLLKSLNFWTLSQDLYSIFLAHTIVSTKYTHLIWPNCKYKSSYSSDFSEAKTNI